MEPQSQKAQNGDPQMPHVEVHRGSFAYRRQEVHLQGLCPDAEREAHDLPLPAWVHPLCDTGVRFVLV